MSKAYGRFVLVCSFTTAILTAGYVVAGALALDDGPGGIEIPAVVRTLVSIAVCSSIVLGGVGWLIRAQARETAAEMTAAIDDSIRRAADTATARAVAQLREITTGEVMTEMLNAAVARAYRAGMVFQAQSPEPPRVASVVPFSRTEN